VVFTTCAPLSTLTPDSTSPSRALLSFSGKRSGGPLDIQLTTSRDITGTAVSPSRTYGSARCNGMALNLHGRDAAEGTRDLDVLPAMISLTAPTPREVAQQRGCDPCDPAARQFRIGRRGLWGGEITTVPVVFEGDRWS
jgi:hypothetical protein